MACTIASLLIMTDWQAIPHDPCTNYSLFHHPELVDTYTKQLLESPPNVTAVAMDHLCIPQPMGQSVQLHGGFYVQSQHWQWGMHETSFKCNQSSTCQPCSAPNETCTQFVPTEKSRMCVSHYGSADQDLMYTHDRENTSQTLLMCTLQHQKHNSSSCFTVGAEADVQSSSQSFLAEVHIQSLQVVQSAVYEIAVNRCESVDSCHWIPNAQVTHKHCSDCQPICRNPKRTLNFIQFSIGLGIFFATLPLMYTGTTLMLSNAVSRHYQVCYCKLIYTHILHI